MRKNFGIMKFLLLSAMLVVALVFGMQSPSSATFMLIVDDPSTSGIDFTITDNGANDSNAQTGAITLIALEFGKWTLSVTTGITNQGGCLLDLNNISVSSSSGGTLTMSLIETTLNPSGPFIAEAGGTSGGTVDFSFIQGGLTIATLGTFGVGAFSGTSPGVYNGLHGLEIDATIVHTGAANTSFNACAPVPLPGAVLLLGAGLARLTAYARRKRQA